MKKFVTLLLALTMMLALVACGGNTAANDTADKADSADNASTSIVKTAYFFLNISQSLRNSIIALSYFSVLFILKCE